MAPAQGLGLGRIFGNDQGKKKKKKKKKEYEHGTWNIMSLYRAD
jgi:hypothetical protein